MATYATNHDFINGEIIPALGDHALDDYLRGEPPLGDFDIDGIWTELRDRGLVVYRTHGGAAQLDGFEWAEGSEDEFWAVVQRHA
jgi:hypothetical protein